MGLEENLAQLPGNLSFLLADLITKEFGTEPFTIGDDNAEYEELASKGLLIVLGRNPHNTTYQLLEEIYNAVRKYNKPSQTTAVHAPQGKPGDLAVSLPVTKSSGSSRESKTRTRRNIRPHIAAAAEVTQPTPLQSQRQTTPPARPLTQTPQTYLGAPFPSAYLIKLFPQSIMSKLRRLLPNKGFIEQMGREESELESKLGGLNHTYVLSINPSPTSEPSTYHFELRAILFGLMFRYVLLFDSLQAHNNIFGAPTARTESYADSGRFLLVTKSGLTKKGAAYFVDILVNEIWQDRYSRFVPEVSIEKELLLEGTGQFISPIGSRGFLYVQCAGRIEYVPMSQKARSSSSA